MMKDEFIVTIKLPKRQDHNPLNKVTGECPASVWVKGAGEWGLICSDVTGQHHSFIFEAFSLDEARQFWADKGVHVTRIEKV